MKILLKDVLIKRKPTYRQAEILTGISKSGLQDIANEKRNPRLSTMEMIAAGLKVRITDLFKFEYK